MQDIIGDFGAACMSVLAIIAFLTGVSAMTFLGPRVYAAMARDGFLPAILKGKEGKPPVGAVILQGAIALILVHTYNLREMLGNVGAILTLFSALTIFSLFWVYFKRREYARPAPLVLAAGAFYLIMSAAMLSVGFSMSRTLILWVVVCAAAALIGYFITTRRKKASDGDQGQGNAD
jgi:APA family basic amino acid/polyamine antiporter